MPLINVVLEPLRRLILFFERRRGLAVIAAAIAVLAAGASFTVVRRPPLVAPAVDWISAAMFSAFSGPLQINRLFSDRGPSPRVMALELELATLRELQRENARLRAMLGYGGPPGYQIVPARVVAMDLDPLRGVAWIDVGRRHGLHGGEAVMTVEGLVGVVERAWPGRSRVRLLRNQNSPVSVRDVRSRTLGVVEWEPSRSRMVVGKVPFQADMAVGDTLISSGLGGVFPPGLPVGTVGALDEPPERLVKSVELNAFANFLRLEEVFVLLPEAGPLSPAVGDSLDAGPGEGG